MFATAQVLIFLVLFLLVFVLCVVALIDAVRRPAQAYTAAGKRTKGFWAGILGVATAVAFVAIPWPVGIGELQFLAVAAAIGAAVYLADVRPALMPYSGGGRRRPGGRPGGGW